MVTYHSLRIVACVAAVFILSACAHQKNETVETAAPITLHQIDCVKQVITNNWEALQANIEYCKNFQNADGISPLMMSAYKNQQQIFENLLASGSDVHLKDKSGSDALFYAVNFQRAEMIKILRSKGARITMNEFKVNALWIALQKSRFEVIENLNPSTDEINMQGEDGWNAVYFAIRRKEEKIFDFIIAKIPQVNLVDSEGVSPYVFAKEEVKWDYAVKKLSKLTTVGLKKKN